MIIFVAVFDQRSNSKFCEVVIRLGSFDNNDKLFVPASECFKDDKISVAILYNEWNSLSKNGIIL